MRWACGDPAATASAPVVAAHAHAACLFTRRGAASSCHVAQRETKSRPRQAAGRETRPIAGN